MARGHLRTLCATLYWKRLSTRSHLAPATRNFITSIDEDSHQLCWAITFTPQHRRGNRGLTGQLSETFLWGKCSPPSRLPKSPLKRDNGRDKVKLCRRTPFRRHQKRSGVQLPVLSCPYIGFVPAPVRPTLFGSFRENIQ